jgi:hypothetical protein
MRKEIATLVAEKCVDPTSQRPYPVGLIEKAMAEAGFSVNANKTAKAQVSECIRLLQTNSTLPIQRARMRIRVSVPVEDEAKVKPKLVEAAETLEEELSTEEELTLVSVGCVWRSLLAYSLPLSDNTHRPGTISGGERPPTEGVQGARADRNGHICRGGRQSITPTVVNTCLGVLSIIVPKGYCVET